MISLQRRKRNTVKTMRHKIKKPDEGHTVPSSKHSSKHTISERHSHHSDEEDDDRAVDPSPSLYAINN
jgi:hypothetical protein